MRLDDGWKHLRLVANVDGRKVGTDRYRDRTPRTASYGPGNHGSENSVDRVGSHCFYELRLDNFSLQLPGDIDFGDRRGCCGLNSSAT